MKKKYITICFAILMSWSLFAGCSENTSEDKAEPEPNPSHSNFIHARGQAIFDGNGNEIILKGIGLGGWFLQEGYMLGTTGPQHEIRSFLEEVAGKAATDKFYEDWLKYFVAEKDVAQIKEWGYNSIRIPLHYNLFFDDNNQWIKEGNIGFKYLDNLLNWCKKHGIYLILDLHAAPGGQGLVRDICDGKEGESLWEDPRYQDMTVLFWYKMAERYSEETWIGGYDLLNEPNYDFENSGSPRGCNCKENVPLRVLHERMIDTIRIVDKNHLLIMEGNCMGGNYNGIESLATYDKERNVAFSFHDYWIENTVQAIQRRLALRSQLNVPLWRGEIGENSNTWFTHMVKLMDQLKIGWANWPWKKINNYDGPVIIEPIPLWNKVIAYKSNRSNPRPTTTEAQQALEQLIENLKLENCRLMHDVAYAYINLPLGEGSKPYAVHTIPGIIQMSDYDYGEYKETWFDTDYQNTSGSSTNHWNRGGVYRNDGVDIWKSSSSSHPSSNGYFIGEIKAGEWLQFTMDNIRPGEYTLTARVRSKNGGALSLFMGEEKIATLSFSDKDNVWRDISLQNVYVPMKNPLRVVFDQDAFDIDFIQFND